MVRPRASFLIAPKRRRPPTSGSRLSQGLTSPPGAAKTQPEEHLPQKSATAPPRKSVPVGDDELSRDHQEVGTERAQEEGEREAHRDTASP